MDWRALNDVELLAFADAIIRVARELRRSLPPPTGMPLYGLDMTICDPAVLDRFSEQGIFRKYQRAVSLGCGLGGVERWWSGRFGCSVACVDRPTALADAAHRLGVSARFGSEVGFLASPPTPLALRAEKFTNAWRADDPSTLEDVDAFLAETFRVLRPGGFFALRVCDEGARADWSERLRSTGFYSVRSESLPPLEVPAAVNGAEQRLESHLAARADGERLRAISERMRAARRDERPSILWFAERPA